MNLREKEEVIKVIIRERIKGKMFGIRFVKRTGAVRTINSQIREIHDKYIIVWSNNDRGYRRINLQSICWISFRRVHFIFSPYNNSPIEE